MAQGQTSIGVLLMGFGGPNSEEEVVPFLQKLLGQRVPVERLREAKHRYQLIGGYSPLLGITLRQARGLEKSLMAQGTGFKVYVGMRHWHPFIAESLEESIDDLLKETPREAAEPQEADEPKEEAETPEDPEPAETAEVAESEDNEEPLIEQAFDTGILSEGDAIKEETSKLEGFPEDSGEMEEEAVVEESDDSEGLQCPKCNFLNSKDSWYCEKCGAELLQ